MISQSNNNNNLIVIIIITFVCIKIANIQRKDKITNTGYGKMYSSGSKNRLEVHAGPTKRKIKLACTH